MQKIINIHQGVPRKPEWRLAKPVDFTLNAGEHIAIFGPNGSGKSMLADIIIGAHPLLMRDPEYDFSPSESQLVSDNIRYITFRDSYGTADGTYYLQQRWNQAEIEEDTPTVRSELVTTLESMGKTMKDVEWPFDITDLIDKPLIMLSSGELRKFQLTRALLAHPRVLILDNPFIGLDEVARRQLTDLLTRLADSGNVQLILLLSRKKDIPPFINKIVTPLEPDESQEAEDSTPDSEQSAEPTVAEVAAEKPAEGEEKKCIVACRNVSIRYGNRTILKELNWVVNEGEHWLLTGPNGCGKSTLLSLVCADNPQSYACDIALFGRDRGSGESIWDIKRHIGYVSPEMHRAYSRPIPTIDIVASGLFDSVGLYHKPRPEQRELCTEWLERVGLKGKEDANFLQLSSGEQRLVLLARAFVKDPDLLILDEPLHGLDDDNCRHILQLIDDFCQDSHKTIIYVTHYMDELPRCIDHQLVLKKNNNC